MNGAASGGGALIVEEAAGNLFEHYTGLPLIVNPLDIAQQGTKLGAKKFAETATRPFGAIGPISRREFDPSEAGGAIRDLTTDRIKITHRGVDYAERHLDRFGPFPKNQAMIQRLRDIADQKLKPEQVDLNFYNHGLRESVRYRNLGYRTGQPLDLDDANALWNHAHIATLEDYRLREGPGVLYHSTVWQ